MMQVPVIGARNNELHNGERKEGERRLPHWIRRPHVAVGAAALLGTMMFMDQRNHNKRIAYNKAKKSSVPKSVRKTTTHTTTLEENDEDEGFEPVPVLDDQDDVSSLSSSSPSPASPKDSQHKAPQPSTKPKTTTTTTTTIRPTVESYKRSQNRVQPVVLGSTTTSIHRKKPAKTTATASSPTVARVSAAMMRNIQSRQRGRREPRVQLSSSTNNKAPTVATTTPTTKSSIPESPTAVNKSPASATTMKSPPASMTPVKVTSLFKGTSTAPINTTTTFKVYCNNSDVYRIRCEATFDAVRDAIADKMGSNATTNTDFVMEYTDKDGDTCVLSSNEDVDEAIRASAGSSVVKLNVTVPSLSWKDQLVGMWNRRTGSRGGKK